jgi:hypothetical protein
MADEKRIPIFRAEHTMADYLRPLLQMIYPPQLGKIPDRFRSRRSDTAKRPSDHGEKTR